MSLIFSVDTGGTFTDIALFDLESGAVSYAKALTTYDDLVDGVLGNPPPVVIRPDDVRVLPEHRHVEHRNRPFGSASALQIIVSGSEECDVLPEFVESYGHGSRDQVPEYAAAVQ